MNLLIVDDDSITTYVHTRIAQKTGLFSEIRSVNHGKAAFEIFLQVAKGNIKGPDLVLLDLCMPGMNGFDFLEALNSLDLPKKDQLNIVVLTSSDNKSDIERAHRLGIKYCLKKTNTLKDLQDTIFSLFNKEQKLLGNENNDEIEPVPRG